MAPLQICHSLSYLLSNLPSTALQTAVWLPSPADLERDWLIIGLETAHCRVAHPLFGSPFSTQTQNDRSDCGEVAVCPFHCGLAVNVQRNNHTLARIVTATCIFAKTNSSNVMMTLFSKSLQQVLGSIFMLCTQYVL